ncbi:MAG TPA: hypothetical protein VLF68_01455 [Candidatus Saccharimonadales bacterium]|nr:hypothetical protein [Candidatus Saccharimonadales bacterium]
MNPLSFAAFILASVFSFYIPGRILVNLLAPKLERVAIETISWTCGIAFFLLCTYAFAWIKIPLLIFPVLAGLLIYSIFKRKQLLVFETNKIDIWTILIILFGTVCFTSITFFSGFMTKDGLQFFGINATDGIVHIANIKSFYLSFPPNHPELSGIPLRGYHYFFDFLIFQFANLYHLQITDLYFRFFPILIALLYGAGFYLFSSSVTKSKTAIRLTLFFAYFGQSFAFIFSLLNHFKPSPLELTMVQPVELTTNPLILLSIAMLLIGFYLIPKIRKGLGYGIIAALVFGVLSELKVYIGVIALSTLSVYSLYFLIRYRSKETMHYFLTVVLTGIITAVTYFPNNLGYGQLVFSPFFLYSHFMSQPAFANFQWEIKRSIYAAHSNIFRLTILFAQAICLFWLLNLGLRTIFLFKTYKLFKKEFWSDYNFVLFFATLLPIAIATLFIQTPSLFDIGQFLWIALVFLSVPAGIAWANIINRQKMFFKVILISVLVLSCSIGLAQYTGGYLFGFNPLLITNQELSMYEKIHETVPESSFIVVLPSFNYSDPRFIPQPVVSAMTGRASYYESSTTQFNLQSKFDTRKKKIMQLSLAMRDCAMVSIKQSLKDIGSNYVVSFLPSNCTFSTSSVAYELQSQHLSFYKFAFK